MSGPIRALRAFDRYWYAPMPKERLALLRIAVGCFALVYLLARFPAFLAVTRFHASEFAPVGIVALATAPLPPALVYLSFALTLLAGCAFVLGFRYRVFGPLFALSFLWVTSYRSSFGMKFHTENLVALHLLLLGCAPAVGSHSLDARAGRSRVSDQPDPRYGWPIRAMCAVTVFTYVLAGVAKLRLAGWDWLSGDALRAQVAYDNLRKLELGSLHSPLGAALVAHSGPFLFLAYATLLLELGAPLALAGKTVAKVWVTCAFFFHAGIALLMAIAFPYPLSCVAYLSFFELERVQSSRLYLWVSERVERVVAAALARPVARD